MQRFIKFLTYKNYLWKLDHYVIFISKGSDWNNGGVPYTTLKFWVLKLVVKFVGFFKLHGNVDLETGKLMRKYSSEDE